MDKIIHNWKRFWCPVGVDYYVDGDGFLLDPESAQHRYLESKVVPFEDIAALHCLALLGEPGMGKSTALTAVELAAASRPGVQVLKIDLKEYGEESRIVRALFESDEYTMCCSGTGQLEIIIDSLDEGLLKVGSLANLLTAEFRRTKPPTDRIRLRIACRTAEWPTESLGIPLKEIWGRQNFGIYQLMPLRESDAVMSASLLPDGAAKFMSTVRDRRVGPLAAKPVTLELLLKTFKAQGDLPKTQSEVYRIGCEQLVTESRERIEAKRAGKLKPAERIAIASRIAAITVLCGKTTILTRTPSSSSNGDMVSVSELTGFLEEEANGLTIRVDEESLQEVLGTPLFENSGENLRAWAHRTYAEFLASEYLQRHGLRLPQLRGLLIGSVDSRARVFPQLEETSGWFAGVNREFRELLLSNDPQILLRSDVALADDQGKHAVVANLLNAFEAGTLTRIDDSLHGRLKLLAHSDIAAQLEPYIRARSKNRIARETAIDLAEECKVSGVQDELVKVALNAEEPLYLRKKASWAVAEVGTDESKKLLMPLTDGGPQDPEDELKGIALGMLWPQLMSAAELFARLTSTDVKLGHTYYRFIRNDIAKHLNSADLPAALQWVVQQPSMHNLPFSCRDLVMDICTMGWDALPQDGLFPLVAKAVWSRLDNHDPVYRRLPDDKHENLYDFSSVHRRPLVAEMVPLIADSGDRPLRLAYSTTPTVFADDVPWLLDQVFAAKNEKIAEVWVKVLRRVFPQWEPRFVDELLDAAAKSPLIKLHFENLLEPIALDSERAKKLQEEERERKAHAAERDQQKPSLDPLPKVRVSNALDQVEQKAPEHWHWAAMQLELEQDGHPLQNEWESDITKLPGWAEAEETTKVRLIAGAQKYLVARSTSDYAWFGTTSTLYTELGAYRALKLLKSQSPAVFESLDKSTWIKWIPIVVGYPGLGFHGDEVDQDILKRAYEIAPEEVIKWQLLGVDKDNELQTDHQYHRRLKMEWDDNLKNALLAKVQTPALTAKVMGPLLVNLVQHGVTDALAYAKTVVVTPVPKTELERARAMEAAKLLVRFAPDHGWDVVWPAIQDDAEFARPLLHNLLVTHEQDEDAIAEHLDEAQLGALFIWLDGEVPPLSNRAEVEEEFNTPHGVLRRFRDDVVRRLELRGTPEAIAELQKLVVAKPQIEWLKWVLVRAKRKALEQSWIKPSPPDFLKLISDSKRRIVETGEQLMLVVEESLARLERKLQGKGMVEFLWNESHDGWRPKEEDAFSRYVADHLELDLKLANIVINREVEIRKGEYTDIHITAIPKGRGSTTADHIKLIIEVKGCWHPKVATAMQTQLLDRYLKDNDCNHGIYLVGWFNCSQWNMQNPKKTTPAWTLDQAKTELATQARTLSAESSTVLDSFVLNTALREAIK